MKIDIKPIKFVIQLNEYIDDEIGHGEYVVIDGQESEDISAGFKVARTATIPEAVALTKGGER